MLIASWFTNSVSGLCFRSRTVLALILVAILLGACDKGPESPAQAAAPENQNESCQKSEFGSPFFVQVCHQKKASYEDAELNIKLDNAPLLSRFVVIDKNRELEYVLQGLRASEEVEPSRKVTLKVADIFPFGAIYQTAKEKPGDVQIEKMHPPKLRFDVEAWGLDGKVVRVTDIEIEVQYL